VLAACEELDLSQTLQLPTIAGLEATALHEGFESCLTNTSRLLETMIEENSILQVQKDLNGFR